MSSAATPPNEAPYPTLVGTATSGTPVSPPTALGSAPSMPATTTRQSAASRVSRDASSRWMPATPTSVTRVTAAPLTRAVNAASAATGPSDVPAATTHTVPHAAGSGPTATHPGLVVRGHVVERRPQRRDQLRRRPGHQRRPLRMRVPQRPHDRDGLLDGLAGAVHDLRVPGPPGPLARPPERTRDPRTPPPAEHSPAGAGLLPSGVGPQPGRYRSAPAGGRPAPAAAGPAACAEPETTMTMIATAAPSMRSNRNSVPIRANIGSSSTRAAAINGAEREQQ